MIEVHISKKQIEINRKVGKRLPYIQVANTRDRSTEYGHRVELTGPSTLTHRPRPDGEEHVYLETQSRVIVFEENTDTERTMTP